MSGADLAQWEKALGEKIHDVRNYRRYRLLETDSGKWVVKASRHPFHLRWWAWVDRELRQRGFDRMPLYRTDGCKWLLTAWVDAQPATYQNPGDIRKAAGLLSRFHRAGRGLLTPPSSFHSHLLEERIESRYRSFSLLMKNVTETKGEFGDLLRQYGPVFLQFGNEARRRLKGMPLKNLIQWERGMRCLTHRDLACHNFLIDRKGEGWLIDFETAEYDAQVGDLWQLLSRALTVQRWDAFLFSEILRVYESHRPLTPVERGILAILLGFPNEFLRESLGLALNKKGYACDKTLPYLERIAQTLPRYREFLHRWAGW
ncbi:CotS family spore coat protein [Melghirimyces profundicolus]|uniref:CotS family spore coat protein n=1 Tax=Melghirimyces profundicolus TaxID=1242148 RepID=A0A2T6BGW7_9BACL|nr:phosphotransferase [Melghirimyces profundicolus]PTX55318.1 CotS family spore coat protein [Melghirimyces profundicolus]